jgi:hypothetical protein
MKLLGLSLASLVIGAACIAALFLLTGCVYAKKRGNDFTYISTKNVSVAIETPDGVKVRLETSGIKEVAGAVSDAAKVFTPLP